MDIKRLNLGEPIFLRNLIIYPVRNEGTNGNLEIDTIDNLISAGKSIFYELEKPDINKIIFDNRSDSPVLMIDGEEITGAMQNRIIAQSFIAKPHSHSQIPVICAEEKRWKEIGGFKTGYCSYPKVRSILADSFSKKIDTQHQVWKEIDRKLTITRTKSKTSSMHEIFDNLNDELERYIEGFSGLNNNTIGFIGTTGDKILGCDIFASHKVYNKFEEKLLRSYALDAIEYQSIRGSCPDVKNFFDKLIKTISESGLGHKSGHRRIKGGKLVGQMVFYKSIPLHISAFPG